MNLKNSRNPIWMEFPFVVIFQITDLYKVSYVGFIKYFLVFMPVVCHVMA